MTKTVLITGASRGIGRGIALRFAQDGYNVVVNYEKNRELAEQLVSQLKQHTNAIALQADIGRTEEIARLVQEAKRQFSKIDVLINNAGIARQSLFSDVSEQEFDRMMDVHVKGCFFLSQAVAKDMISRKQGVILNISSIWGLCGASCEVAYSTAKAAVVGMTRALAKELGPSGIRVNCIAPGVVDTDMNAHLCSEDIAALIEDTPLGRLGSAEDIASCAAYLASEEASFLTGQVLSPNGGFFIG